MLHLKSLTGFALLLAAAATLGGCQSGGGLAAGPDAAGGPVAVTIVEHQHGQNSPLTVPTLKLINSKAELAALGLEGVVPAKFGKQSMIVAGIGEQNTGGYAVHITNVYRVGDEVVVQADITRPGDDAVTTQALTQPFCIATTEKLDGVTLASDFSSSAQ